MITIQLRTLDGCTKIIRDVCVTLQSVYRVAYTGNMPIGRMCTDIASTQPAMIIKTRDYQYNGQTLSTDKDPIIYIFEEIG